MEKIVKDFIPQGGMHCITNSLKQVFHHYGFFISEEMMFGIASGLSFLYLNQSSSPMISGRTKVFEFEKKLAERLNISVKCKSGKDYPRIEQAAKAMIDSDNPVLIYVDMPYLNYLGLDESSHFGGHAVVLFGYDDEMKQFYISDRDNHDYPIRVPYGNISNDYHLVSYEELENARSSSYRPFPAHNKYLVFNFDGCQGIHKNIISDAIKETCGTMLNPPAQLLGINGIRKFSKEILKWKEFSPSKLRLSGTTNYFQINKDGGTGGGIFRRMYGAFLIESAPIMNNQNFIDIGNRFINLSGLWDDIADDMWQLSLHGQIDILKKMSEAVLMIYDIEKNLYLELKETVK